jgi:hypothetical protein
MSFASLAFSDSTFLVIIGGRSDEPPQGTLTLAFQVLQQMFRLYSGGDEHNSMASHLRQKVLAALIDEG